MKPLHPQSIKAVNRIYNSYRNGKNVKWVEIINDAVLKGQTNGHTKSKPRKISAMETILNQVAEYFNFNPESIRGMDRHTELIFPRHLAMLLMFEAGIRNCVIDRFFGRTDGCAGHGKRNAIKLIDAYPNREGKYYAELRKLTNNQQ